MATPDLTRDAFEELTRMRERIEQLEAMCRALFHLLVMTNNYLIRRVKDPEAYTQCLDSRNIDHVIKKMNDVGVHLTDDFKKELGLLEGENDGE